jgi:alpha-D-ribose 1-methylphosphonate 5-triphosphate synthase subunit PhnI
MGYTSVANRTQAVDAAAALVATSDPMRHGDDAAAMLLARAPLLIDHVAAEAGIIEPQLCARAVVQAQGDLARAVSLVRAWAATLPRAGTARVAMRDLITERRITPGFLRPSGGQYLGASLDYAQRLLDVDGAAISAPHGNGATNDRHDDGMPASFPAASEPLRNEGLIAEHLRAQADDVTRSKHACGRGAFMQLLARGETGTLTALAYTAIRGFAQRQDPTLMELRSGMFPVRAARPDGVTFVVGQISATIAEIALYRLHDETGADPQFTLGVGATAGRVERRAIAAAMLDAGCARAASDPDGLRRPSEDEEFITIAIDGQETSGFVEHLKLPHYVTFTSDLDRVRAVRTAREDA